MSDNMKVTFSIEDIELHREHAAMAAMVDTDTFRAALDEIERLRTLISHAHTELKIAVLNNHAHYCDDIVIELGRS
jgi:hypothetical protein